MELKAAFSKRCLEVVVVFVLLCMRDGAEMVGVIIAQKLPF